jgi:predicted neuraminidase
MNFKSIIHIIVVLTGTSSCLHQIPEEIPIYNITSEFIFKDKVTTNCHAATIVELENHQLLAAWFGGTHEGAKDVGIYTSTFTKNSWSKPTCLIQPFIQDGDTLPCWNPVLFLSKSKQLYLFYKVGKNPREWFGAMVKSSDMGKNWSKPEFLPKNILGPIKNKPIEIENGIILCGSSTEKENEEWRVHVEKYNENNNSWKSIAVKNTNNFDVIQPTFIQLANKDIQMLCRSKHNRIICSWSKNNGDTWSRMDSIAVPNSNSGIDAISVSNDLFLMVNNPLKHGTEWFNGRNRLDVEYSKDGIKWKKLFDLENQDKGQFSYPAIIQTSDQQIHIVYTYNREYIKHVSFKIKKSTY